MSHIAIQITGEARYGSGQETETEYLECIKPGSNQVFKPTKKETFHRKSDLISKAQACWDHPQLRKAVSIRDILNVMRSDPEFEGCKITTKREVT